MLINLTNRIGKIKNKQDMHLCSQDLCITKALNPSNILLLKVQRLNLTFVSTLYFVVAHVILITGRTSGDISVVTTDHEGYVVQSPDHYIRQTTG